MKLGPYNIIKKLAVGGVADIYLAKGRSISKTDKYLVCKCLKESLQNDSEFLQSIINEAQLSIHLRHPNILEVFDLCVSDNNTYLIMEYMDAHDLQAVLAENAKHNKTMPIRMAIYAIGQAALGLHAAHELCDKAGRPLNLVHRDISPQNILLGSDGSIKIADFGIAKTSTMLNITPPDIIKGKFNYMSPEHAWADKIDRRSDIFSLAVTFYEAVLGTPFYPSDNVAQTIQCARVGHFSKPSEVQAHFPRDLEAVLLKALELDKNERYRTALEFKMALDNCANRNNWLASQSDWHDYLHKLFRFPNPLPLMCAGDVAKSPNSLIPSELPPMPESLDLDITEQFSPDDLPDDIKRLAVRSSFPDIPTLKKGPNLHSPTVEFRGVKNSQNPKRILAILAVIALCVFAMLCLYFRSK